MKKLWSLTASFAVSATLMSQSVQGHHNQNINGKVNGDAIQVNNTYNFNVKVSPVTRSKLKAAQQTGSPADGWLRTITPGNEPLPDLSWCQGPDLNNPKNLIVLGGNGHAGFIVCPTDHCSLIHDDKSGKDLVSLERTKNGAVIQATVFDTKGKVLAVMKKSETHVNTKNAFEWSRPDAHTIDVIDQYNHHVLTVRFLNPRALEVKGYFANSSGQVAVIADDGMHFDDGGINRDSCAWNITGALLGF